MENSINNIVYMEIYKNAKYEPVFGRYCIQNITHETDAVEILHQAILNQCIPSCEEHVPTEEYQNLSFTLLEGRNIYAIRFAKSDPNWNGGARFGPGMAPITLIGSDNILRPEFLTCVRLVTINSSGQIEEIYADQISEHYECVPADCWAVFECDLRQFFKIIGTKNFEKDTGSTHEHDVKIPFYLNIYDEETKLPIWLGLGLKVYHDGYHPPSLTNYAMFRITHKHG